MREGINPVHRAWPEQGAYLLIKRGFKQVSACNVEKPSAVEKASRRRFTFKTSGRDARAASFCPVRHHRGGIIGASYALIGHPLWPFVFQIHARLFALEGIDARYDLTDIVPGRFTQMPLLRRHLRAFNVTRFHTNARSSR